MRSFRIEQQQVTVAEGCDSRGRDLALAWVGLLNFGSFLLQRYLHLLDTSDPMPPRRDSQLERDRVIEAANLISGPCGSSYTPQGLEQSGIWLHPLA
jgi:hypothetical protein